MRGVAGRNLMHVCTHSGETTRTDHTPPAGSLDTSSAAVEPSQGSSVTRCVHRAASNSAKRGRPPVRSRDSGGAHAGVRSGLCVGVSAHNASAGRACGRVRTRRDDAPVGGNIRGEGRHGGVGKVLRLRLTRGRGRPDVRIRVQKEGAPVKDPAHVDRDDTGAAAGPKGRLI